MLAVTNTRQEVVDAQDTAQMEGMENRLCPGCRKSAVNENGGLVVAFGQSFFHVDCFKCAKCGDQVTADTNLLLLSDGSPICANCSYSCNVCHLPILDEAIMTGDDSYHAHCFKCKVCKNRIDELVFAKTSQGIYCMNCHNDRMAKIRKHAQKKREREKAGGSGNSATREREASEFAKENGTRSPPPSDSMRSKSSQHSARSAGTPQIVEPSPSAPTSPYNSLKNKPMQAMGDEFRSGPGTPESPGQLRQAARQPTAPTEPSRSQPQLSVNGTPSPHLAERPGGPSLPANPRPNGGSEASNRYGDSPSQSSLRGSPAPPSKQNTGYFQEQRPAPTDGVRPLDIPTKQHTRTGSSTSVVDVREDEASRNGLQPPGQGTSRAERRRSINPGAALNFPTGPPRSGSPTTSAPSPHGYANGRAQTPPVHGYDPPRVSSPLRAGFPESAGTPMRSVTSPQDMRLEHPGTRMRAASSSTYIPESRESPEPTRPPLRPSATLERVPPRMNSLANLNGAAGEGFKDAQGRLSPGVLRPQHSFDDRRRAGSPLNGDRSPSSQLNLDLSKERPRANSASRSRPTSPTSPAHWADVPHSIESGTDTEAEGDSGHGKSIDSHSRSDSDSPPAPPPKEAKQKARRPSELQLESNEHADTSYMSRKSSVSSESDASDDSPAMERTSVATFIAPALPPIRFSMNSNDFGDLLKSVGGLPSLKSLDQLAKISEGMVPATPPPTALPVLDDATQTVTPSTASSFNDITPQTTPSSKKTLQYPHYADRPRTTDPSGPSVAPLKIGHGLPKRPSTADTDSRNAHIAEQRKRQQTEPPPRISLDANPPGLRSASNSLGRRERGTTDTGSSQDHSTPSRSQTAGASLAVPDSLAMRPVSQDKSEQVVRRLQEVLSDASDRGAQQLKLEKSFLEVILSVMEQRQEENVDLRSKLDGVKRASKQYIEGLTVAQTEYDQELKARRDAEAEVTRLRVLLSGQAARLTAIAGETKRQELRQQMSEDMSSNLDGLERDLSQLKVQRDMTLAEVEELAASKSVEAPTGHLGRSLTMRLDNIKTQYQHELVPLTRQRESLAREIAELKAVRDVFLEETTALNARNEELAKLSSQYARRAENAIPVPEKEPAPAPQPQPQASYSEDTLRTKASNSFDRNRSQYPATLQSSSTTSSNTLMDDADPSRYPKPIKFDESPAPTPRPPKFIKWPGSKQKEQLRDPVPSVVLVDNKVKGRLEHTFQQVSALRITRCDHCGDKLFGSQLRCSGCNIAVHVRCINHVDVPCSHKSPRQEPAQLTPLPPSMFGRDLTEQVRSDTKVTNRLVPIIVEKCISAVEALAMDYEGIYRKTGGSGQSKAITQLFERGDYHTFDLCDSDRFNDICSVTSVLKNYFRSLPIPLLTYDLHDNFMMAAEIKDPSLKNKELYELVTRLPVEHYETLRVLMLHLHRVMLQSDVNLMTSRNLGVVFGPTLMRSRDPSAEFSDMAGKALSVEWFVENAETIFGASQDA
ncbi:hypothetical protein PLICRDRAFT_37049 [Plicaturopsis crispa FD-325 SS-3]|nr:hypothetical protein PLICRDRAFT_37049 [Plicaturopsis crispa FD-325 SS-3]